MSIAKEEIFELCKSKKANYSKIFEKSYQHTVNLKDDSSQIITFSLILHERVKEIESKSNNRLSAGLYHLIWIEHFLNHLYKKQNLQDLQKICIFYKSLGQNLDPLLLFIIDTYLYVSTSRFMSTDSLAKVLALFDQPKDSLYNQLCLTWKTLEVVHSFVKDRIDTFKGNEIIIRYLQESIKMMELGQRWDGVLQKNKFIKLDTESYSFLKRTRETLSKISGVSSPDSTSSTEGVKNFNAAVALFNEKKYTDAILKLNVAIGIFEKAADRGKLERVLGLMGKIYYAQNSFEESMNYFEKALHSSDLSQETFKFYIEQFEKCKLKLKMIKKTLYSEKLKKEENATILMEELRASKSVSTQYGEPTYKEQLVIVEKLLEYIYKEKCIERVMLILEKQKICCSIDYNLSTLKEAISNCEKCIEIVKDSSYDELAICYAEMGIYQLHYNILSKKEKLQDWKKHKENEETKEICDLIIPMMKKGKELKFFKAAIQIWKQLIQKTNSENVTKYFKDLDRSFDHLDSISHLIKYYGYQTLYIESLEVLIMFNRIREEDEGLVKTKLAEIMIDLGNTSKAQELLLEKFDNPYYELIQVYYEMEKGNITEINKILTNILSKCKGNPDYMSLCRYYIAQVYFYKNDQSAIDSCLQGLSSSIKKFSNSTIIEKVQDKILKEEQFENLNQTDFTSVCKSLLQLAKIYESRGFFKESTHTLLQGLFLSLSSSSDVFVLQFLSLLGELEKKRNRFSKSNLYLKVADDLWNTFDESYRIDNRNQYLSHLIQLGDLLRVVGDYNQSNEIYEKGFKFLQYLESDSYQIISLKTSFYLAYSELQSDMGIDQIQALEKASESKLLIPEEAKVDYYMGKYYLIKGDKKKAENYFSQVYDLTSLLIPSLSRGSLSSLALLSKEDQLSSSYFSNISMNLGLRLKKLGLSKPQSLSESFSNMTVNNSIFNPDTSQEFVKDVQEILPNDMNVCTISLSFDYSKLIISRISKDQDPIVIEIPLIKSKSEISKLMKLNNIQPFEQVNKSIGKDGEQWRTEINKIIKEDEESTLLNALNEFEKILQDSNETTKSGTTDKKEWWKKRHQLDDRMKNLLEYLEHILLSQWKGIISESTISITDSSKLETLFCEKFKQCGYETKKDNKTIVKSRKKNSTTSETIVKKVHTVLILDKLIQRLPWENLPILKEKSISRMPSIMFLYSHLNSCKTEIDLSSTYYVLNPSGDLTNTQKTFEGYFKEKGWKGSSTVISSNEYKSSLESYDLFVYMGHGGGEKYCKGNEIAKLKECAVTLLMGCSSGVLYENGEYDPDGIVLNYILGKCPCVVANLWDVTDGDCDRFSMELLENCHSKIPLIESVIKSREKCKLKYLIGCAPVCYGLPIKIK